MEIKLFYKTQREVADIINHLVDNYWECVLTEDNFIENILTIYRNNPSKILKNSEFTTILKQKCGKRRLDVIHRILEKENIIINKTL